MRKVLYLLMAAVLAGVVPTAHADSDDAVSTLRQKLASQFALTKMTARKDDIVMAGSVLVLHKDGLVMYSTATPVPPLNTYKKGKISQGFGSSFMRDLGNVMVTSANNPTEIPQRKFQDGEKFWVTGFTVQNDGVVFQFYSDPYDNIRYYGQLKFPFPKGQAVSADEELKAIAEVITVDGANAQLAQSQPPAPQPTPTPIPAPTTTIPAPPPPSDVATKTISLGDNRAQVIASFGQPQKIVKLPSKEIDYYSDMKVTYVNEKVTSVDEIAAQDALRKVSQ